MILVEPTVFNVPRYFNTLQVWSLWSASIQYSTLFSTLESTVWGGLRVFSHPKTPQKTEKGILYFPGKYFLTSFGPVKWQNWSQESPRKLLPSRWCRGRLLQHLTQDS